MKAIQFQRPGVMELVDIEKPTPGPDWARIRVHVAAICMTDFAVLEGSIPARYPLVPGHEWSGVVDAVGSEPDQAWLGRKVIADNELTCLECAYCRRGEWRRCPQYRQIGFHASGGYAEYLLVPVRNLYELPESVSFEQGSLLEPLSLALAVSAMAQPRVASTAVILGAGPIGLNCLAALKASGVARILCLDLRSNRLDLARSWGATATFSDAGELAKVATQLHPEGTDLVIEATGNEDMVRFGTTLTRFGGAFVLAGYCDGKAMETTPDIISLRNLRVLGAGNICGFMASAARCAADGMIRTEQMITHRYKLEDYKVAFSRDAIARPDYIKGIFSF
jgi:L-iditol 2-dehydrogenase